MLANLIETLKVVGIVCGACTGVGGIYYAADGPLPAGRHYVDGGFAELRLAQSQTSVSVDRLLQSQLMSERSGYTRDPVAAANPQVQVRVQQIDQQLAIINRRIEDAERKGVR